MGKVKNLWFCYYENLADAVEEYETDPRTSGDPRGMLEAVAAKYGVTERQVEVFMRERDF